MTDLRSATWRRVAAKVAVPTEEVSRIHGPAAFEDAIYKDLDAQIEAKIKAEGLVRIRAIEHTHEITRYPGDSFNGPTLKEYRANTVADLPAPERTPSALDI